MYREKIEAYFADKQDQIVADICRLIAVKSEREEAKPGMPFGEGPYNALMEGKKLAEEMGFFTKNFDNYVVSAEMNDKEVMGRLMRVNEAQNSNKVEA